MLYIYIGIPPQSGDAAHDLTSALQRFARSTAGAAAARSQSGRSRSKYGRASWLAAARGFLAASWRRCSTSTNPLSTQMISLEPYRQGDYRRTSCERMWNKVGIEDKPGFNP